MDLMRTLSHVFGKGQKISDGIVVFSPTLHEELPTEKNKHWRSKQECWYCNKVRVCGKLITASHRGAFCYNCFNAQLNAEGLKSISRRKFHKHVD